MVNGRLEKISVVLYFSSSCAKSAPPLAAASFLRVLLDDAPEEPEQELEEILPSEAEVDCLFRASSSDETTVGV